MFIVAIGWMYVVLMMSITETTPVAGIMTFILYGLVPVSLLLYISGGRQRKRRRAAAQREQERQAASAGPAAEEPGPPPA
jgi:biotin transporter BioY